MQRVALAIDRSNAREELAVEENRIVMGSLFWGLNRAYLDQRGIAVGANYAVKRFANALQELAAFFQRNQRVVEALRLLVAQGKIHRNTRGFTLSI